MITFDAFAAPENSTQASRDPLPVFMKEEVQTLLRNMTGFDIVRVAGPQKVPLRKPRYKLLTDEELEQVGVILLSPELSPQK